MVPSHSEKNSNFQPMKQLVKVYTNLYHEFGKGLYECWIN